MEITLSFEILTACRLLLGEKLQWEKDDSTSIRKVFGFSLDFCFFFSFFSFFFLFSQLNIDAHTEKGLFYI